MSFASESPPSTATIPTAPSSALSEASASITPPSNLNPANFVLKEGDTMLGPLTLSGNPTDGMQASTKMYVDSIIAGATGVDVANFVLKTGSAMSGLLTLNATPSAPLHAVTKDYCDTLVSNYVAKLGDTMAGALILHGAPTLNLHAATKAYVDTIGNLRVLKAGDTMSGPLILSGPPTESLHACTKEYVDTKATNNAHVYSFGITFVGTDPVSFTNVPTGWTVTIPSIGVVHVVHNISMFPKGITGWGLTTTPDTWKQALFGGNSLNITYVSTSLSMFEINGVSTTTMNAAGLSAHVHIFF